MRRLLLFVVPLLACGTASSGPGDAASGVTASSGSGGSAASSAVGVTSTSSTAMAGAGGTDTTSSTGGGAPVSVRYDQVRIKAVHNAYQRFEGLFDQLAFHRARALELDLHPTKAKWPEVAQDWFVYHDANDGETSCHRLSDCLDAIAAFDRAVPEHEVITLVLDLKADLAGPSHAPSDLDARLAQHLDADTLFTPADLAATCPTATTLRDAVKGACGWPQLDALRGKVIVITTGASACATGGPMGYVGGGATALTRQAFAAPEITSSCGLSSLEAQSGAVFANMSYALRDNAVLALAAGLVSRVWSANDAGAWDALVAAKTNLLATDKVNVEQDPWARTHAMGGWPFACMTGECDPPASEIAPVVRLEVRSGDIWGKSDDFFFVSKKVDPAERSVRGFVSVASSHVDEWAKGCLMARASLAADAAYAAVCRPADRHPIRFQVRATKGGDSTTTEIAIPPPDTVDAVDASFVRLDVAAAGKTATAYGSVDGLTWVKLGSRSFAEPLVHQGLAASGHGSAEPVRFLFGDVREGPANPSSPLVLADFPSQLAVGDCSVHAAVDGHPD
ncbi:MAG: hypothetical protein FJ096_22470 [Deltaproteobacteria bacterium]|nr:hypothetical protein [Deltaproteobacteria bacterium]